MSKHHVRAVFEQFPWMRDHFGKLEGYLQDASVSRISHATLALRDGTVSEVVCDEHIHTQRIFLFDKNGVLITQLSDKPAWRRVLDFIHQGHGTVEPNGKSVREALNELGSRANLCAFVVVVNNDRFLTVFRKQHLVTIRQLLDELDEIDRKEERAASEEVRVSSSE